MPQIISQSTALQRPPLFLGLMTDFHYVSLVPKDGGVSTGQLLDKTSEGRIAEYECMPTQPENLNAGLTDPQYPKCWTSDQWLAFKTEYPWLTCTNGSLGCSVCETIKVIGPAGVQGTGGKNLLSAEWMDKQHSEALRCFMSRSAVILA